ncbi:uncharacterized protein A1O9_02403 [Exophiala aquamarina CBS 119918]|uniref:Ig-like domain-containing protein n=1 Tax=Exophiala aquamarina CBS 119918 TaxID=1182545 RepID=A0A072PLV3_9EURO|nr:uncharacterized protein A1O9_02403 [Exophiala aquamarina CBS 119918]KEF60841.1 hypothetical protein A1O9_02403 [Exophiala aquamarina CBS 119918]
MKSAVFSSAAALFFAAIACSAPLSVRDSSVIITIKTGDGDSATTLSVPLDHITITSGQSSQAVAASVSDSGVFCQAFSDAGAAHATGPVFSAGHAASYSATSSGGTESVSSDAVDIGSFLCSNSQAGVAPSSSSSSSSAGTSATPSSSATVRVQLEQVSDQFVQTEIPLDTLIATGSTNLGSRGLDLSLVTADGIDVNQVACQVFADAAGQKPIGVAATATANSVLTADRSEPAVVAAIQCSGFA